jgi:hypothetical protein
MTLTTSTLITADGQKMRLPNDVRRGIYDGTRTGVGHQEIPAEI